MYIFNIKIGLVIIHVWYNFASNKNNLESERDRNEVFMNYVSLCFVSKVLPCHTFLLSILVIYKNIFFAKRILEHFYEIIYFTATINQYMVHSNSNNYRILSNSSRFRK